MREKAESALSWLRDGAMHDLRFVPGRERYGKAGLVSCDEVIESLLLKLDNAEERIDLTQDQLARVIEQRDKALLRLDKAKNLAELIYQDCPGELDVLALRLIETLDPTPKCEHDFQPDSERPNTGWEVCSKCGMFSKDLNDAYIGKLLAASNEPERHLTVGEQDAMHRALEKSVAVETPCRIMEYDGAYRCATHERTWGAVPEPDEPCTGFAVERRVTK